MGEGLTSSQWLKCSLLKPNQAPPSVPAIHAGLVRTWAFRGEPCLGKFVCVCVCLRFLFRALTLSGRVSANNGGMVFHCHIIYISNKELLSTAPVHGMPWFLVPTSKVESSLTSWFGFAG